MIVEVNNDRIKLEIMPSTSDEKAFCETINRLVMYNNPFILHASKRSGQIKVRTGHGVVMALPIKQEHLHSVCELLRRQVACTQMYSSGYAAGCIITG